MKAYTILRQQSPLPAEIPPFSQPGFFFNDAEHVCQQSDQSFHVITALNGATQQTDARCTFFSEPDCAVSPVAAPFGSIEFVHHLPDDILSALVDAVLDEARATGASRLRLVNYPDCYAPEPARRLAGQLLRRGFRVAGANQTFYLPITASGFENGITAPERRRLHTCQRAGFHFALGCDSDLDAVLSFLVDTRQRQGYRLTISTGQLRHLIRTFPGQFPVFVVRDGPAIAALTVAVRVRDDILYTFLPASHPDYHAYSPMVLLTAGLYQYCQRHQIRLLDLGVSLDGNHQPKPSLMRFKRNLGALESPKLVFEMAF